MKVLRNAGFFLTLFLLMQNHVYADESNSDMSKDVEEIAEISDAAGGALRLRLRLDPEGETVIVDTVPQQDAEGTPSMPSTARGPHIDRIRFVDAQVQTDDPPAVSMQTPNVLPTPPQPTVSRKAGFLVFEKSGNFVPPLGIKSVRVVVVGGGSAGGQGGSSLRGGGGSGSIVIATVAIPENSENVSIPVRVGRGGQDPEGDYSLGDTLCMLAGEASSFGEIVAEGGKTPWITLCGGSGASGGGAGGGSSATWKGGAGGCRGSKGEDTCGPNKWLGGAGCGSEVFASLPARLAAAPGGQGGLASSYGHPGGGGAGGIKIDGKGPSAGDGTYYNAGKGGSGYGAGGGGGGYKFHWSNSTPQNYYGCGGKGAPGVVYVEWLPEE